MTQTGIYGEIVNASGPKELAEIVERGIREGRLGVDTFAGALLVRWSRMDRLYARKELQALRRLLAGGYGRGELHMTKSEREYLGEYVRKLNWLDSELFR